MQTVVYQNKDSIRIKKQTGNLRYSYGNLPRKLIFRVR